MIKILKVIIPFLIILSIFLLGLIPIHDYDFWWHLKTGEYILENKKLPDTDPFSYTAVSMDRDSPERPQFILKQYWLGQVIFALIVNAFGLKGFIIMRAFIFALIGLIAFSVSSKFVFTNQKSNPPTPPFSKGGMGGSLTPNSPASLRLAGRAELRTQDYTLYAIRYTLLFVLAMITTEHLTSSPQMFSFLFAVLLIYILERHRTPPPPHPLPQGEGKSLKMPSPLEGEGGGGGEASRYTLYAIPFLMLLWPQIHGGYTIGIAFLIAYLVSLPFEDSLKRHNKILIPIILLSILVTYINPNRWEAFILVVSPYRGSVSVLYRDTLEYLSPVKIIPFVIKNPGWISYWVLIGLSIIAIINLFKNRLWSRLIILAGTMLASLISMRYAYFFAPAAVAIIPSAFNYQPPHPIPLPRGERTKVMGANLKFKLLNANFKMNSVSIILVLILAFTFIFTYHKVKFKDLLRTEIAYGFFPEQASEFISSKGIPQPIFNDVQWGGFLIYKLWPEYKVFVDTRTLNIDSYRQYMNVLNWTDEGRAIIDVYGIKSIITPAINPYTGEIFPLIRGLMVDDNWSLVYLDGVAMIFVKKEYAARSLPKSAIYQQVFYEVMFWSPSFPNVPGYQKTMEELQDQWKQ